MARMRLASWRCCSAQSSPCQSSSPRLHGAAVAAPAEAPVGDASEAVVAAGVSAAAVDMAAATAVEVASLAAANIER